MTMFKAFILLIATTTWLQPRAIACSSFHLEVYNNSFVGKSYDWRFGDGYLVFNPSRLIKTSHSIDSSLKHHKWKSLYSSLTYNQYGLEFPNGGINSKGLTVEVLWLDESIYEPIDNKRPVFNELQWIQYILDTQSTVRGAMKEFANTQINPIYGKVHYFICDSDRHCATVEYVNGIPTVGTYDKAWFQAITNSTYEQSVRYLNLFKNFGGTRDVVWEGYETLDRFVRINELLRVYRGEDPLSYSFNILDSVKRDKLEGSSYTQWQVVYDIGKRKTYFKTMGESDVEGHASISQFKDNCNLRQYVNINSKVMNGKLRFKPLTKKANSTLVETSLRKVMPNAPDSLVKEVSGAPFTYVCAD